jgi:hypothetical protein
MENLNDDSRQHCQDFNRVPSEYTSNSLIVGYPAENREEFLPNTPTEPYEYTNLHSIQHNYFSNILRPAEKLDFSKKYREPGIAY